MPPHRAGMEPPGYLPHAASQTVELLTVEPSSTCEFAQEFAAVCSAGLTDFVGFQTSESEFVFIQEGLQLINSV